jgi:hypothetical protein
MKSWRIDFGDPLRRRFGVQRTLLDLHQRGPSQCHDDAEKWGEILPLIPLTAPWGKRGKRGKSPEICPSPPLTYREGERGNRDAAKKVKVIHKKVSRY